MAEHAVRLPRPPHSGSVNRFLGHFQPSLALILETELWPNMLFGCRDR
ncbi:hypothetical protein C7E25_25300, partial [Stenotrophomonas maltophilia]